MKQHKPGNTFGKGIAVGSVIPGMAFTLIAFGSPAQAAAAPGSAICNGVVNRLAHRGAVQENLL